MASAGPNSGGTFADDATVGTVEWLNPGDVVSSNNVRATAVLNTGSVSHYLKATNFGFSIPDSIVNGIVVEIERKENTAGANIRDNSLKIVKGGIISGDSLASASEWPTTEAYATYGGSTALWGLSWAYTDINDSGFGVAVSAKAVSGESLGSGQIDHIRITVYYTVAWTKGLSDSLTLSDSIAKSTGTPKADTVSLSDTIVKNYGKLFSDSVSLSDALVKSQGKGLSDSISLSDLLTTKGVGKSLSDSIALSDNFDRVVDFIRLYGDTVTLSDSIDKQFSLALSDSISLSDAKILAFGLNLADIIALSDSHFRTIVSTVLGSGRTIGTLSTSIRSKKEI